MRIRNTDQFVRKARKLHGDRYNYSKVEYSSAKEKVIIGCPDHGWFEQTPSNHTHKTHARGCPKCGGQQLSREERLFANVIIPDDPNECWEWVGYGSRHGQLMADGEMTMAHRLSWEIHNGEIPDGLCVLHTCDNPPCSNPRHLFLGTHADNMQDMIGKKRHGTKGRRGPNAVHTKDDIIQIRKLLTDGVSQKEIAEIFGVSQSSIMQIKTRRSYRWVK